MFKRQHSKEMLRDLRNFNFEQTDDGILFPGSGIEAKGFYIDRVNGGEWTETPNIVPYQGLDYMLNSSMNTAVSREASWYLAIHNSGTTPTSAWTANGYTAAAAEIVSGSEGYSESTRPAWQFAASTNGEISSYATPASFTIVTASTLTVTGAAVLSASAKGSQVGVLASATNYGTPRTLSNADNYQVGYRMLFVP